MLKLYNTLTKKIEEIKRPEGQKHFNMYTCGPTVYNFAHIGNLRSFILADLLYRTLKFDGYNPRWVMNITDIDDKTLNRSREEKIPLKELTRKYEAIFLKDLKSLNILVPNHLARATENVQDMITLIEVLIKKGVAYKADDGVYMSIEKVKDYGALAGLNFKANSANSKERIANDEYDKENPRDFAIWKFKDKNDANACWETSFGAGRPGWHIECSAMAMKILGETIDIHTGGSDLLFPHHVNEIAQSESATGKKFANYWIHGAFMTMKGEKMAKSKGNIIKIADFADQSISPLAYRYWLMTAHYRSPINFGHEAVLAAQSALFRLVQFIGDCPEGGSIIKKYQKDFQELINDDFNTPKAVALMWELVKDPDHSPANKRATILDFDHIFGLKLVEAPIFKDEEIPLEVTALAEAREEARNKKDWKQADAMRMEIENRGFDIKDGDEGFEIRSK